MANPTLTLTLTGMDGRGAPCTELGALWTHAGRLLRAIGKHCDPPHMLVVMSDAPGDGEGLDVTFEALTVEEHKARLEAGK